MTVGGITGPIGPGEEGPSEGTDGPLIDDLVQSPERDDQVWATVSAAHNATWEQVQAELKVRFPQYEDAELAERMEFTTDTDEPFVGWVLNV